MRAMISSSGPPVLLMMLPRYWKLSTSSYRSCPILTPPTWVDITFIILVLSLLTRRPVLSPAPIKSTILLHISCSLWVSRARSSAYSRSSNLCVNCHWIPRADLPKACLVTQSRTTRKRSPEEIEDILVLRHAVRISKDSVW